MSAIVAPRTPPIRSARADSVVARRRITPSDFKKSDGVLVLMTALSAVSIVWIVFDQLTLLSGALGFVATTAAVFLSLYYLVNRQLYGRRVAADRATAALVTMGVLCLLTPLALIVEYLVVQGSHLLSWHFISATQNRVLETCAAGHSCVKAGVLHAIIGTFEQVGFAVLMGVPAGVLTAIFLNEVGGRGTQAVRVIVTAMSGLPAIVAGIFIYSVWVVHFGFSGLAGSLALAVLLLPTVTRGTEEVLKIVPDTLREASAALGAPQWRTVWSVVLPTAQSGILTAVLLSIAVAIGETAPLLFTVFGAKTTNWNLFSHPQASLPLLIYTSVKSSQSSDVATGYTAALVLFILVFSVFILARILGSAWLGHQIRSRSDRRATRRRAQGDVVA
ncbi:MAG: phosphate ABC transporter permease PstA [Acidimicrobiales bacterium]